MTEAKRKALSTPHGSRIVDHLEAGGQVTNGVQNVSWSKPLGRGYLSCDTLGCCDSDFDSFDDLLGYLDVWCGMSEWDIVENAQADS